MAKTHIYRNKTAWIATPPHVLDHRKKVEAVTGKYITKIQNYLKAHLDVRNLPLGHSK
jgi:hypothetical protein